MKFVRMVLLLKFKLFITLNLSFWGVVSGATKYGTFCLLYGGGGQLSSAFGYGAPCG